VALAEPPRGRLIHATGDVPKSVLAPFSAGFFLMESPRE
jgi:hypothetical protein